MSAHIPVLCKEIIDFLRPVSDKVYVDCTLGDGGHTKLILEASSPTGRVISIDCDKENFEIARNNLKKYGQRIIFIHDNFINLEMILEKNGIKQVNGILFDLGISSRQLDSISRGFSFQINVPLDMRMDMNIKLNAADLVNNYSEEELRKTFFEYSEERWSKRIARRIVEERKKQRIETTDRLVQIIKESIPCYRQNIHPATRVFQALRISVNDELHNLEKVLPKAIKSLTKGGKILVISFHSLEDRIVKNIFKTNAKEKVLSIITKKPVLPTIEEMRTNPRSRSAKLRVAEVI